MKILKTTLKISSGLIFVVLIIYQFDFTKRIIASYGHKVKIPNYISSIQIKELRISSQFPDSKTVGKIQIDKIFSFYTDINGEQVIANSMPMPEIAYWANNKPDTFTIVYRNFEGNLNGINLLKDTKGTSYKFEMNSHFE